MLIFPYYCDLTLEVYCLLITPSVVSITQSAQVDACYIKYTQSLGKTGKDIEAFKTAIREETEHLVMIDDILSELAMMKRVVEDQTIVYNTIPTKHPKDKQVRSDWARLQSRMPGVAPPWARSHVRKLDRHTEDARRVRQSLITLLDMRQRQASTENALYSDRQSRILFEQSKVLFVFTGATVIFAPLSWVSSLLDLEIKDFTPDAWSRGQTAAASSKYRQIASITTHDSQHSREGNCHANLART